MENYLFPLNLQNNYQPHTEYVSYFSPPECASIIEMGMQSTLKEANISNNIKNEDIRKSNVAWFRSPTPDTKWLWDKMSALTTMANARNYNFTLVGFLEAFQFTEYDTEGSHYTWHMDHGGGVLGKRKLSLCIQLSDPETYEGGNLELFYGLPAVVAKRDRGTAVIFPSYTMHRVTPITSGKRYSLVVWASGTESYK